MKRDEVIVGRRNLLSEKLGNLCTAPNIIKNDKVKEY
jgi:hypothetical protein